VSALRGLKYAVLIEVVVGVAVLLVVRYARC
jgi:hypothetical protein